MSTLLHVLGYGVPWWLWALAALAAAALAFRLGGARAAALAGALAAIVVAHRRGAQGGYSHALEQGEKDAQHALDAARAARDAAVRRDGDAGRLRDDDGFRRD